MSDQFTVDGDPWAGKTFTKLSLPDITWAEADLIEQVTGTPITVLTLEKASELLAFSWIAVRRVCPQTTFGDLQAVRVGAIRSVPDPPGERPDPTAAGAVQADQTGTTSGSPGSEPSPST